MIPFGMRPQIMGWPFRLLPGAVDQNGRVGFPLLPEFLTGIALRHARSWVPVVWELRAVTGAFVLAFGLMGLVAVLLHKIGGPA